MPIKHILCITPFTRINDEFITGNFPIDASPVNKNILSPVVEGGPNSSKSRFQADFYKKIACDIVSETVLNYPYPYISEKTLRPIACKRMFIILGAPYTLELLHSKGFQTFDDFVDETYDTILNPEQRFLSVVKEVEKICVKSRNEIVEYLRSIEKRLEHNFHTLKNLENTEIQELKEKLKIDD